MISMSTNIFREKTQSKTFSTVVKAACILLILAGFLPFATISCAGETVLSVSGYDLAFGAYAEEAAEMSGGGNMGLGMGMGEGQLAALNLLAGVNILLIIAFSGTGLLLFVSIAFGRSRLELMLSLMVAAFSVAAYAQWLVIFSAFARMFDRAMGSGGGPPMSAGPGIGLYTVMAFCLLLLLAACLEMLGKLPCDLGKRKKAPQPAAPQPIQVPGGVYYPVPGPVSGQSYPISTAGYAPGQVHLPVSQEYTPMQVPATIPQQVDSQFVQVVDGSEFSVDPTPPEAIGQVPMVEAPLTPASEPTDAEQK